MAVDAQDLACFLQLSRANLRQPMTCGSLVHVVDLALLAAGRGDQHHAVSILVRARDHAAGQDGFIVGVRMHKQKRLHTRV